MAIAAILLAASGVRIGGAPLALAPWGDGETVIEYEIGQLRDGGVDVIEVVVDETSADLVIPVIARDDVEPMVVAAGADEAAALRVGAAAVPRDTEKAVILRVTEPRPAWMIGDLLDAHRGVASVARVVCGDGACAPVVVGYDVLAALRNIRPGMRLHDLLSRFEMADVAFDGDVVTLRIETDADLKRAQTLLTGVREGRG